MKSLLKTVTECIDKFSQEFGLTRFVAIIGGEAVIMHGVPRTTIDLDLLLHFEDGRSEYRDCLQQFGKFLKKELEEHFEVKSIPASRDPFDPLRHNLIIITDRKKQFKKLDILMANFAWELEGFKDMEAPDAGQIMPYPIPYLVGLKLLAGGIQDEQDVRNLFLVMSDQEKEKARKVARAVKRDKNLERILGGAGRK